MCVYVCLHICMSAYMYVCIYVCLHNNYVYVCIYVCLHICMSAYMYVCIYVRLHICMSAYMYVCIYVCLHICMHIDMVIPLCGHTKNTYLLTYCNTFQIVLTLYHTSHLFCWGFQGKVHPMLEISSITSFGRPCHWLPLLWPQPPCQRPPLLRPPEGLCLPPHPGPRRSTPAWWRPLHPCPCHSCCHLVLPPWPCDHDCECADPRVLVQLQGGVLSFSIPSGGYSIVLEESEILCENR